MVRTKNSAKTTKGLSRRQLIKGAAGVAGVGVGAQLMPGFVPYIQAQSSAPIKIGFQVHRTGIGAAYGRWYERTTTAAAALINEQGGINGRPVEIVAEDDGTDPKRGAEVVEKFDTSSGDVSVIRLMGPDRQRIEKLTGGQWDRIVSAENDSLQSVAGIVKDRIEQSRQVIVNVNNHYEGCAVLTIDRLIDMLGGRRRK